MTMWVAVLLGCAACYALKLVGYLVPGSWLEGERTSRITTLLPVALLAALIAPTSSWSSWLERWWRRRCVP